MQIFVKQPVAGPTLVYQCSEETTLENFLQWVEDKTAIPEQYYYILYSSHYIPKYTEDQKQKTFRQLGIVKETTILLNGRINVKPCAKKLNASA